jgi:hypothetical protein
VSDHASPSLDTSPAPDLANSAGHRHLAGGLRRARRIAAVIWLSATGVQIVLWAVICLATVNVDAPWWLWTLLPGAVVVGVLRLLETDSPPRLIPPLNRSQNESDQR